MTDPIDLVGEGMVPREPDPEPRFRILTRDEILSRPPKPWTARGLFGTGDLVMVYGPPGGGKTFVVLDWLFALEAGERVAGRFPVTAPTRCLYVASEGVGGIPGRFVAAAVRRKNGPGEWPELVEVGPNLTSEGEVTEFIDCVREAGPFGVVAFDTLHGHTTGADENSAQDGGVIVAALKRVARELESVVIVVHHEAKHGGERGTSAFRGAFDCLVRVAEERVTCSKLKDAEPFEPVAFRVEGVLATEAGREYESASVCWLGDARRETVRDKVLGVLATLRDAPFAEHGLTAEEVAERTGEAHESARKALRELAREGKVVQHGEGKRGSPHTYGPREGN